jgi:1-acyl-sn-glycerol-3-phosphate acyltransferase
MRLGRKIVRAAGGALLSASDRERLSRLAYSDAGHGYDVFGMHPDWLGLALAWLGPFYRSYFRVTSHGAENIPSGGPVILVANHAGTLPVDATMICLDVFEHVDPPRMPRAIADLFLPQLPFASATLGRMGAVTGTRDNVRRLLERGEICLIFPEGTLAIGKHWTERYRLQQWRVGHAELALRYRAKVVPVAVIGSEEQWPQLGRVPGLRPFGLPYWPVVATPLPLPVHYHLYYGEPLDLAGMSGAAELSSDAIAAAAATTRCALEALIARGLAEREGVFR